MSSEVEIEKTYLAKFLPAGMSDCRSEKMLDIYLPKESKHAKLRVRQKGDSFVITKKNKIEEKASSVYLEESIELSPLEFAALEKIEGNRVSKTRYYFPYKKQVAEIDVFSGKLEGLVLVDFEFKNSQDLKSFTMPDFCLADVSSETIIAGGVLCHKSIKSLANFLKSYSYKKIDSL